MQTIGRHIISTQLNDMVGREDEVNRICGLLSSCDEGLLWVHGPGGIGKTTVMYAVEKQLSSKHGFLWVDFGIGGFQDIAAIREMIAGHIRRSPEAAPIIVFDSFEKAKQLCDEELRSIADCTGGRHLLVFVSRSPPFLRFHRTFDRNKAL